MFFLAKTLRISAERLSRKRRGGGVPGLSEFVGAAAVCGGGDERALIGAAREAA